MLKALGNLLFSLLLIIGTITLMAASCVAADAHQHFATCGYAALAIGLCFSVPLFLVPGVTRLSDHLAAAPDDDHYTAAFDVNLGKTTCEVKSRPHIGA